MWTTLNFEGRSKTKKWAKDIRKETLDIECERDWPVGLGAKLGEEQKIKSHFSSFRDFPWKANSVILLGFECTINPQNLIEIVLAIFEKMKIFNFFLKWTTLNFRGRGKLKKTARDIYKRTVDIEFEQDRSIDLGSTIGDCQTDGQTDRHTHTHTHTHTQTHSHIFVKHIFRLWEWCRIKNHQKVEVEFFYDCNTSFTPNVARK